jgi:hypothetical protein
LAAIDLDQEMAAAPCGRSGWRPFIARVCAARVHAHAVRANPAALDETFGSLRVTIVRDAKVFVAPMTDLGLGHGFFAIGSTALTAADGSRVTAVSIKGEAGSIAGHDAILRRVIGRSVALLGEQSGIQAFP